GALGGEPARAGCGAAADLQHPASRDVAEQARVGLPHALRAPDEVDVADVAAVLGQVVVGVGVPPGATRPLRLGGADIAPRDPRGAEPLLGARASGSHEAIVPTYTCCSEAGARCPGHTGPRSIIHALWSTWRL